MIWKKMMQRIDIDTDVLIIGGGIAGLRAAIEAAKSGREVLLISKSAVGKANNTYLANGLFAVSHEDFSADAHFEKTLQSGRNLNRVSLVRKFVNGAPNMIQGLRELGLKGRFLLTGFGTAQSSLIGGPGISSVLVAACRKGGVRFLEGVMITSLLVRDGRCLGALGFDKRSGNLYGVRAGAVLLATGGAGAIYAEHDNAPCMTGDGYVLGLQEALELVDMEFVQFYPLVYAGSGKARMIIPAALADLGEIKNRLGEDLKKKYELHEKPIAIVSRDRLAQSLFREICLGNGVEGALLLDLRNVDDTLIPGNNHFKARLKKRISYGREPIKIVPACHHTMGGLIIDGGGHTGIENLFAAGEVVGGIHGANRMGGNALSEALVFGAEAGSSAVQCLASYRSLPDIKPMLEALAERFFHCRIDERAKSSAASHLMKKLGDLIWKEAGILRNGDSLKKACEDIGEIQREAKEQRAATPWELSKITECTNSALNAQAIAVAALERTESRGCHYREDYPLENPNWEKSIHIKMTDGIPKVSRVAVTNRTPPFGT